MRLVLALLMLPLLSYSQQPTEPADPLVVVDSSGTNLEVPDTEVSSEDQEATDFKPTEEISEDFPIPLPYDI
ncbi:MAG: hypothetical protein HOA40_04400 [Porticoccaceae bacterium]|nr:hypothetical protein [Porticoccaceae bacterium]MBT3798505.1 hypothetical protein [Porticoccaceae bacterium]MBT4164672.1 hypothetical protein [Porticoccaceae bacterium]MBT4211339.1 hypothetical protein [Porticoccaceae bacterium]MBT4592445.1 hypothetical protein [Porticoccaceae bacterium]